MSDDLPVLQHATHVYIRDKVREISGGRRLTVLDVGCGEGELLELLHRDGHDVFGYDLRPREERTLERLSRAMPGIADHLRFTTDERRIPFASDMFDVVCSNQVLEHVKHLDAILCETARVLRPGGVHVATFPYATHVVEAHLAVPFVHLLPPSTARTIYLAAFALARGHGRNAMARARRLDTYLREHTYYRFRNEFESLGTTYFERYESDAAAYVRTKRRILSQRGLAGAVAARAASFVPEPLLASAVAHLVSEVALFVGPKKDAVAEATRHALSA